MPQILDNLVGREEIRKVSTLSQNRDDRMWGRPQAWVPYPTKTSNESLIPAQNQRWRRA